MKILITVFFTIIISVSETTTQWEQISTIANNELRAVKFFNEYTGIVVGQGGIWRSTSSGVNWTQVFSGINFNSLSFPDNNNGYSVGDSGKIFRTFDNGQTWSAQISGISENLYGVYFYNASTGHTVGQNGKILRTQNGGSLWTQQVNFSPEDLFSINMSNTQNAFAVGGNSNEVIAATANGGSNWLTTGFGGNFLKSVTYISNFNLVVCGGVGRIRKSTNSGASWDIIPSGTTNQLNCVTFLDGINGYICGNQGTILKSTNSGSNWLALFSSTSVNLKSLSFINANTGWAVGSNGVVLRTGIPVGISYGEVLPNEFKVYQNYPNPFNNSTMIEFDIPSYDRYSIYLYNILGELVSTILDNNLTVGRYKFSLNTQYLASGLYIVKFNFKNNIRILKIILAK